jgi:hypothetical protein
MGETKVGRLYVTSGVVYKHGLFSGYENDGMDRHDGLMETPP